MGVHRELPEGGWSVGKRWSRVLLRWFMRLDGAVVEPAIGERPVGGLAVGEPKVWEIARLRKWFMEQECRARAVGPAHGIVTALGGSRHREAQRGTAGFGRALIGVDRLSPGFDIEPRLQDFLRQNLRDERSGAGGGPAALAGFG